jgi:hypothetical protein
VLEARLYCLLSIERAVFLRASDQIQFVIVDYNLFLFLLRQVISDVCEVVLHPHILRNGESDFNNVFVMDGAFCMAELGGGFSLYAFECTSTAV